MLNVSARIIPSPMISPTTEQKDFVLKEVEPLIVTPDTIIQNNVQDIQKEEAVGTSKIPENAVIDELTEHNIENQKPQEDTPVLSRIVEDYALEMTQKNESSMVRHNVNLLNLFLIILSNTATIIRNVH